MDIKIIVLIAFLPMAACGMLPGPWLMQDANATETLLTVDIGQGRFKHAGPDAAGMAWTQYCCAYQEQRISGTYGIGLRTYFKPWLAVEIGYNDLGNYSINGVWTQADDGTVYSSPKHGYGRMHASGFNLGPLFQAGRNDSWHAYIGGGAFSWHAKFNETICDGDKTDCGGYPVVKSDGVSSYYRAGAGYKRAELSYSMFRFEPRDGNTTGERVISLRIVMPF